MIDQNSKINLALLLLFLQCSSLCACTSRPKEPEKQAETPPDSKRSIYNLEYSRPDSKPLLLDLHLPGHSQKPSPLIVWIHGGGWKSNHKASFSLPLELVDRGYAVVCINYRLSQTAEFPAQINDAKAAVRWLRANAGKYHLDPKRIGAWGNSSGGHLAALLGTTSGVKLLEGTGLHLQYSSKVQAVCTYYAPLDLIRLMPGNEDMAYTKLGGMVAQLLGEPLAARLELARLASPIHHVSADDAPFLIVHGDKDKVVPIEQSRLMHAALQGAGVLSQLHIESGASHSIKYFKSELMIERVAHFFDTAMGASP